MCSTVVMLTEVIVLLYVEICIALNLSATIGVGKILLKGVIDLRLLLYTQVRSEVLCFCIEIAISSQMQELSKMRRELFEHSELFASVFNVLRITVLNLFIIDLKCKWKINVSVLYLFTVCLQKCSFFKQFFQTRKQIADS